MLLLIIVFLLNAIGLDSYYIYIIYIYALTFAVNVPYFLDLFELIIVMIII